MFTGKLKTEVNQHIFRSVETPTGDLSDSRYGIPLPDDDLAVLKGPARAFQVVDHLLLQGRQRSNGFIVDLRRMIESRYPRHDPLGVYLTKTRSKE